jgi:hypothetical protein
MAGLGQADDLLFGISHSLVECRPSKGVSELSSLMYLRYLVRSPDVSSERGVDAKPLNRCRQPSSTTRSSIPCSVCIFTRWRHCHSA